ncbi:hypothetical protein EDC01DRAFT_778596 [Geopyxis carbonaria]|nr:hypothetical protein EDC01DRAFT_778596 [Geopyxis carbonaria]
MTLAMPPNPNKVTVNRTANAKLDSDGFAVSGNIPHQLISRLPQQQLILSSVTRRFERQIELQWNADCEAVAESFETNIKPHLDSIRNKPRFARRLVYFHGKSSSSGVYRLEKSTDRFIVMILVQPGTGLPHVCRGSHRTSETSGRTLIELPHKEGNAVIMHPGLVFEDPAVGVDGMEGLGAWCVFLVY